MGSTAPPPTLAPSNMVCPRTSPENHSIELSKKQTAKIIIFYIAWLFRYYKCEPKCVWMNNTEALPAYLYSIHITHSNGILLCNSFYRRCGLESANIRFSKLPYSMIVLTWNQYLYQESIQLYLFCLPCHPYHHYYVRPKLENMIFIKLSSLLDGNIFC